MPLLGSYISKKSHSGEKVKRENPLVFLNIQFVAKYQKNKRNVLQTLKKFRKKSNSAEKNEMGDHLASSGLCYAKKDKMKRFALT